MAVHNLPHQVTSFVGRSDEIVELTTILGNPSCRLLTLVGAGGIGKTRLAIEVVHHIRNNFSDGVCFVPLAHLASAENIPSTIVDALPFQPVEQQKPRHQILNFLRDKHLLLLLDNFEHLLDGVDVVTDILSNTPQVKIMITSRETLNIREEWVWEVRGLPFPNSNGVEKIEGYGAVKLFVERARQIQQTFSVLDEYQQVIRICQIVDGMPLALELAATWIKTMSCADIAQAILQDIDFLKTRLRNVPERHRSMRAVFNHTWNMLDEAARVAFQRLSIFRGGFLREAAEQVAGTSLPTLASLADNSILSKASGGRYAIHHELLRQYGEEQLETAGESDAICMAHCIYFTNFLAQQEPGIKGRQRDTITEIGVDFENIRLAWHYAVEHRLYHLINHSLASLVWYGLRSNRTYEVKHLVKHTHEGLAPLVGEEPHPVWGRVLAHWLWLRMLHFSKTPDDVPMDSRAQAQRCLDIARQHEDSLEIAFAHFVMGYSGYYTENYDEALNHLEAGLTHYRNLNDDFGVAQLLQVIAYVYFRLGRHQESIELCHQIIHILQTMGDRRGLVYPFGHIGIVYFFSGQKTEAERYLQEAIALEDEFQTIFANYRNWLLYINVNQGEIEQARAYVEAHFHRPNGLGYFTSGAFALGIIACIEENYAQCPQLCELLRSNVHDSPDWSAWIDCVLALAACGLGKYEVARHHVLITLRYFTRYVRSPWMLLNCTLVAAFLLDAAGEKRQAVELLGLFFTHPGAAPAWKHRSPLGARLCQKLEAELGTETYDAAWTRGQSLDLLTICNRLLHHLDVIPDHPRQPANRTLIELLSDRELEVLRLIAEGWSTSEIAEVLVISVGTVKRHVYNVNAKLGTRNRLEAVERARSLQLIE